MAITIGNPGASTNSWPSGYFLIDHAVPADGTGTINSITVYNTNGASVLYVGIYSLSGGTYTLRSSTQLNCTSSSPNTFTGLSLAVQTGDFIGVFVSAQSLGTYSEVGANLYYVSGQTSLPSSIAQSGLTNSTTWKLSIIGTGTASKKWNNITIGKYNGVVPVKINNI